MVILANDVKGQWYINFNKRVFPKQKEMTKEDYVIVVGEFGINNAPDEWMEARRDLLDHPSYVF